MSTTVRKNGKAYDSGDVIVSLLGDVESEVKSISYTTDQEHQLNHSLANNATSWSMGKYNHEFTLELYVNAARKIEKLANAGDLMTIAPFDVNVTFANEFNELINDTITCKFMSQGRAVTGEMGLAYQYKMFALGIQYNNV